MSEPRSGIPCENCLGAGLVRCTQCAGGLAAAGGLCRECSGSGWKVCRECRASGRAGEPQAGLGGTTDSPAA